MTTKTWNFSLEGRPHTLILDHRWLSGKRTIVLDGQLLESVPPTLFASGSVHEYQVDGHSLAVIIQEKTASFAYDFLVDGVSLDTGERGPQRVGNTTMQGTAILAVIMILFGLGISWFIKSGYDRQLVIQEWSVITGKITSISTDYHADTNDDNADDSYYHAILKVEYVVGDARFTSQVDDNEYFDTESQASVSRAIGERQALYVNPANPQEIYTYFEKLDQNAWVGPVLIAMGATTGMAILILIAVWFQTRNSVPVFERS